MAWPQDVDWRIAKNGGLHEARLQRAAVFAQLLPNQSGEYGFACPIDMSRGRLIAE